jgi:hypothetical protein
MSTIMLTFASCFWLGSAQACQAAGCDSHQAAETLEDEVALLQQKLTFKQAMTNVRADASTGTYPQKAFMKHCPEHMEKFKVSTMWKSKKYPCPKEGMSCVEGEVNVLSRELQMIGITEYLARLAKINKFHLFKGLHHSSAPDIWRCNADGPSPRGAFNFGSWTEVYQPGMKKKPCRSYQECATQKCECAFSQGSFEPMGVKFYQGTNAKVIQWITKVEKVRMCTITPYPFFELGMYVYKHPFYPTPAIGLRPYPTPVYENTGNDGKGPPKAFPMKKICFLPWQRDATTVVECDTNTHEIFFTGPFTGCTSAIASLGGLQKGGVRGKFLAFHMNTHSLDAPEEAKVDVMKDMVTWALAKHNQRRNEWRKAFYFQSARVYNCFSEVFIFGEVIGGVMQFMVYGAKKHTVGGNDWNKLSAATQQACAAQRSNFLIMPLTPWTF